MNIILNALWMLWLVFWTINSSINLYHTEYKSNNQLIMMICLSMFIVTLLLSLYRFYNDLKNYKNDKI